MLCKGNSITRLSQEAIDTSIECSKVSFFELLAVVIDLRRLRETDLYNALTVSPPITALARVVNPKPGLSVELLEQGYSVLLGL